MINFWKRFIIEENKLLENNELSKILKWGTLGKSETSVKRKTKYEKWGTIGKRSIIEDDKLENEKLLENEELL